VVEFIVHDVLIHSLLLLCILLIIKVVYTNDLKTEVIAKGQCLLIHWIDRGTALYTGVLCVSLRRDVRYGEPTH